MTRRTVYFPGGPASYLALGREPEAGKTAAPLLLLHGFAGDLLTWQLNMPVLGADRRVLAVDLPGHGQSTLDVGDGRVAGFAPWLLRFLDAVGLDRMHVAGHSMGGYVGMELARLAPERVASLTLIASAGLGPDFDLGFLRRVTAVSSEEEGTDCAARLFAGPCWLVDRIGAVLHAQAADPARRAALERITEQSFAVAAERFPPVDWSAFPMPVQAVWGAQDRIIPLPSPHMLPHGAPLHVFDKAGHLPHSEAAGPTTTVLRDFLNLCDAS
ncbi:alpha/beta fold hydrolase [Azospirillum sp. SYSU D00513]|uniref:alpha/beta fold hydrolase n=1 Tax=Azospirillum sp. SYSU D00513 TaxID=2812561 RepID=UPI001A95FCC8|nr:alpha/beta fold hydrolase [Azospirillum sp. SYSU D00513]